MSHAIIRDIAKIANGREYSLQITLIDGRTFDGTALQDGPHFLKLSTPTEGEVYINYGVIATVRPMWQS